jgi:hypothetical protein
MYLSPSATSLAFGAQPQARSWISPAQAEEPVDEELRQLHGLYASCGGMARAVEVIDLFRHRNGPGMAELARWIVRRDLLSLDAPAGIWLPLFQFNPDTLRPQAGLAPVLAELNPVQDASALARWFASPQPDLAGRAPAQVLLSDPGAVLQAARRRRRELAS